MISFAHPSAAASAARLTGRAVLGWLVAFFLVVAMANTAMVWLALTSWSGVRTQSAYQEGAAYPRELAAARAQRARDWRADVTLRRSGAELLVDVTLRDGAGAPLAGLAVDARLERPTQDREDHAVALHETAAGAYRGRLPGAAAGGWQLILEAGQGGERLYRSVNRISLD